MVNKTQHTCGTCLYIVHTLMSFEGCDELKTLILQSQHINLTTVVGYEHIIATLVKRHVHTPRLRLKTAQFPASFSAAPLKGLVSGNAQYPLLFRNIA